MMVTDGRKYNSHETLTKEDLTILKAPFEAREHEFLRGFVYITEFAIVTRIEDVDPAWQFEITAFDSRPAVGTKNQVQVTCTAALTINGVTRYGVGQMKAYETKPYTDKKTGEQITDEANEAEKSAATDALKRAARLFGIGRYLLVLPGDIKNEGQLDTWIKKALAAKAKAEGLQDADDIAATYDMDEGGWDEGMWGDGVEENPPHRRNDRAALVSSLNDIADKHGYGEPDPHDYDDDEESYDEPPKEHYTTPTNIVVRKIGLKKEYLVIEECTFFSREAFRLLGYDEAIIERLGTLGVTELPDTVTIVYTQGDVGFKRSVRVRRNSINAVVDVTGKPVLLQDSEKV